MNTDYVEEDRYWNIRSGEEIEALCADYGITKDTTVVCYRATGKDSADDRVALALLWAGVENVKCLDGGYEKWVEAGYEEETDSNAPAPTDEEFGVEVPAHPRVHPLNRRGQGQAGRRPRLQAREHPQLRGVLRRDERLLLYRTCRRAQGRIGVATPTTAPIAPRTG